MDLFIVIVLLGLRCSEYNGWLKDLKKNVQNFSHLNALGSIFDLDIKNVKVNLGSSFEGLTSPMLHSKSEGHRPSGSGKEEFLPYMGMVAIFCSSDHGHSNFHSPTIKYLHMKFEFIWPNGFRGEVI